jgi:Family of unknown function (DUF5681)
VPRGEGSRAETEVAEGVIAVSNSRDKDSSETHGGPDPSYAVGNKKPPLHSRFSAGKSGNPSGRPKGRTNFDTTLLKEFYKPVSATINGKPIKVTNDKLFAASLVKDGITKGPQSKLQLANRVERAEARLAADAEAASRKKAAAEKNPPEVKWTAAQEKIYQEICIATGVEPEI